MHIFYNYLRTVLRSILPTCDVNNGSYHSKAASLWIGFNRESAELVRLEP